MFLTKLCLNIKNKDTISMISNVNNMHKLVMSGFDKIDSCTPRKELGVLYEAKYLKRSAYVLVQSLYKPDYSKSLQEGIVLSFESKCISHILDKMREGDKVRIEVLTEPYKKVEILNSKNSKRKALIDFEDKLSWFTRKLCQNGCEITEAFTDDERLLNADILNSDLIYGKKGANVFKYRPSLFKGIIKITDLDKFKTLIQNGLGSGKAYGMGMVKVFLPMQSM